MWTLAQREAIRFALEDHQQLAEALQIFFASEAEKSRKASQSAMLSYPRQYELASDYMAKAAQDDSVLYRLAEALRKSFAGPTG